MERVRTSAEVLKQNLPKIMDLWEARALKEVSAAFGQPSLLLRNSLPSLLHSLSVLLSTKERTKVQIEIDAAELLRSSREHGRGRAEIPAYVLSQVIVEYRILRQILFRVLEESSEFTLVERELLTSALEDAVNTAATEFSLALREIQDQFMLSIAHDLKNPLTSAQTRAELILRSPGPEITMTLAGKLVESMKKMSEMIEDIHDTSRLQAGHRLAMNLSSCDLDRIVHDVIADIQLIYGPCCTIESAGPVVGLWNPEYLRRLIENLANNAAKYRSGGTTVTITLRQNDATAELAVHNFGEPIPEADQANLFSALRWRTVGRSPKGWGLGMVLVKGIVDALRGSIRFESTKAAGTTFTVVLPKKAETIRPEKKAG